MFFSATFFKTLKSIFNPSLLGRICTVFLHHVIPTKYLSNLLLKFQVTFFVLKVLLSYHENYGYMLLTFICPASTLKLVNLS